MKLILTVGISSSGKTTWAKEYAKAHGALIACRDDLRFMLTGANGWPEYKFPFPRHIEALVSSLQKSIFYDGITQDRDVIIADTNLNTNIRKTWMQRAQNNDIEFVIVEFYAHVYDAITRDNLRGNFSVGEEVIKRQYKQWEAYVASEVAKRKAENIGETNA